MENLSARMKKKDVNKKISARMKKKEIWNNWGGRNQSSLLNLLCVGHAASVVKLTHRCDWSTMFPCAPPLGTHAENCAINAIPSHMQGHLKTFSSCSHTSHDSHAQWVTVTNRWPSLALVHVAANHLHTMVPLVIQGPKNSYSEQPGKSKNVHVLTPNPHRVCFLFLFSNWRA